MPASLPTDDTALAPHSASERASWQVPHAQRSVLAGFNAIVRGRRSVRKLRPDPVAPELIEQMLDAARWAPSPHGRQPWRFAVLTRNEPKLRLANAMGDEWQRQLRFDGQDQTIIDVRAQKSHQRIVTAPVVIIPCLFTADLDVYPDADRNAAETIMAIQSLGCAIQNLLLTAYALGLDAGWMCAPLFCPTVVGGALDLDPRLTPHALLTVGYAATDPTRRPRRPLRDLVVLYD
jgi:F420 biosynthesis protein FbiB-like protein